MRRRARVIVGTVRAVEGGRHVVVRSDGKRVFVKFAGEVKPRIGEDVIGNIVDTPEGATMTLARSVTEAILSGKALIAPAGDPEITARLLARTLAGTRHASLRPGFGACLERIPSSEDEDVLWAMQAIGPEAARLGMALNVIDVRHIAASPWDAETLRDSALPADPQGDGEALKEMHRLLRTGFHPGCSKMIDAASGTESVNFVIPYAPFAGGWGFARQIAGMSRGVYLRETFSASEARRLSSVRQMAAAIAGRHLTDSESARIEGRDGWRRHRAACFADALAVIAFLNGGGRPEAAKLFADLKQASLSFSRIPGSASIDPAVWEAATHRSVQVAVARAGEASSPAAMAALAADIARDTAMTPEQFETAGETMSREDCAAADAAAARVSTDRHALSDGEREACVQAWLADFRQVSAHLCPAGENPRDGIAARMSSFGGMHVPFDMESAFDSEMAELETRAGRRSSVSALAADRAGLSRRIKALFVSAPKQDEDGAFELEGFSGP